MAWFRSHDPSPPEDPNQSSAANLVARSCMCIRDGCECTRGDVYVMRSVKPVNVRCPDCANRNCPGAS